MTEEALRAIDLGAEFRPSMSLLRALAGEPIRVGTENQAKLSAVRDAFGRFAAAASDLEVVPVGVSSQVPDQPVGWEEITTGARNRARAALASGAGAIAVGIEDGLVRVGESGAPEAGQAIFNVGCAFVTDGEREGPGYSSGFAYPDAVVGAAFEDRSPIGDLFDDLWSRRRSAPSPASRSAKSGPSGGSGGNIGRLTGGRLERSGYGSQAIVCALVRFLHTDLYD